ncbi:hypothetical protein ACVXG7_14385 [Enterobacter hormaechei]
MGIPRERIIRIGDNKGAPYASDNFWQMGDTSPAVRAPKFYDHGDHIWASLRKRKKMAIAILESGTSSSCSSTVRPTAPWSRCQNRP